MANAALVLSRVVSATVAAFVELISSAVALSRFDSHKVAVAFAKATRVNWVLLGAVPSPAFGAFLIISASPALGLDRVAG